MAKDIVINYSSGEILEPKKNLTLGERFFSGGNPLPEDPTKPINPWAPKPIGPVLPNKMMAAKGGLAREGFADGPDVLLKGKKAVLHLKKKLDPWSPLMSKKNKGSKRYYFGPEKIKYIKNILSPKLLKEILQYKDNPFYRVSIKPLAKKFKVLEADIIKALVDNILPKHPNLTLQTHGGSGGGVGPIRYKKLTSYFMKHHKTKTITQMARDLSLTTKGYGDFNKIFDSLRAIKKKAVNLKYVKPRQLAKYSMQEQGLTPRYSDYIEMVEKKDALKKLDPRLKNINLSTLDSGLKKNINLDVIEKSINPKLKPLNPNSKEFYTSKKGVGVFPSYEHTQGIRPGLITQDPSALTKVRPSTKDINFRVLGPREKGGAWSKIKSFLEEARNNLKQKDNVGVKNALNKVNAVYDDVYELLQKKNPGYKRKILPFYKLINNKITEVNVKDNFGKPQALINSYKTYLNDAAATASKTDLKKIDKVQPNLSKAIRLIQAGKVKEANAFIKMRMPKVTSGEFFSFSGFMDPRMIMPDITLSPQLSKVLSKAGSVLKGAGVIATPLNLIPYAQEIDRGMGMRSIDTGTARLLEDFVNMPKYVTQLAGMLLKKDWDLPYEAKFGRMYADWVAKGIPLKERIKRIEELGTQTLDDESIEGLSEYTEKKFGTSSAIEGERGYSPERTAMLKEKASKPLLPERGDLEIKETENVWGTQIPMKSITEGFSRDEFLAKGGRVGFSEGSKSSNEILEAIKKEAFELENNWNTEKNWWENLADVVDVRNFPYYADRAMKGVSNVAEVSAKLPFVAGELISDLIQKPGFKRVERETSDDELSELFMQQTGQDYRLKPTDVWGKAWDNLMPGTFSEKLGLDSLISDEELRMQEQGMSQWPQIAGSNIELGVDVTLPWGYIGAARKAKQLEKVIGKYIVPGANVDKKVSDLLTDKGMGRRDFMKIAGSMGVIGALKALGLDKLLKGVTRNPIPGPIKMLERSTTKMPLWFPKFIDKVNDKMTYRGDGMWDFTGTDDFLPGFHIERVGDDYYISGKNQYEQDFQITYESPKWEGDADGSYYNSGEFIVEDSVPVGRNPEDVDFDGEVVEDLHDVLGGTKGMEEIAKGEKIDELTKGENAVIEAEVKAEQAYDQWRESDDFIEE